MQLKVVGRSPVVIAHRLQLPGEVFEVPDKLGVSLLKHSGVVDEVAAVSDAATADAQAQPTRRVRRRAARPDSEGAE